LTEIYTLYDSGLRFAIPESGEPLGKIAPGFAEGTRLIAIARTSGHDVVQATDVEHLLQTTVFTQHRDYIN